VPPPATPAPSPPTTRCSTAPAVRPASPAPPPWRRPSRPPPPSPPSRYRRAPTRGAHHRRWVGRGHQRCHHRAMAGCADAAAGRPARPDRHQAAAPLEPQQPGRLRRRRSARHHPRSDGDDRRAPRRARDRLPRARDPEQPGAPDEGGRLLPGPRPGAHRRVPRAPGRALRRGGPRAVARYDKPILTATELAVADPDNAGPGAVRATGRLCYASGNRAVTALGHLWQYAQFRDRRGLGAGGSR
jgi:hypothetical protein